MRSTVAAGAVLAAGLSCVNAAEQINGNWYANLVQKISYTGLGQAGQYQKVVDMSNGCSQRPQDYSGNLSPLDEEVSLHFRGPLDLKQVAIYYPSGASKKTKARRSAHQRRHGHQDFHKRNKEIREIQERAENKRAVGDEVVATIDGQVVSWINEWDGSGVATAAPAPAPAATPAAGVGNFIAALASPLLGGGPAKAAATPDASAAQTKSDEPVPAGAWKRTGYYNADSQEVDSVAFLNNMGGGCSGVFDTTWGLSLSWASHDGKTAACSPTPLNSTIASNVEVVLTTDQKCAEGDPDCGYFRKGSVATHGFGGNTKAFFFEFGMPDDGTSGWNMNMPAVWMLNAQIPRTGQYSGCSCWKTGCGEFDICEVLDSGNQKCKSTFHGNTPGGSSDYFQRPVSGTMKMAVVMMDDQIHVQQLDAGQAFGDSMDGATISQIASETKIDGIMSSVFALLGA